MLKVRIRGEELRKKRLERGFSLGDVASMLGVSRKSVYEYEKGTIEPTVERAERLIRVFGLDILEPIDIFESPRKVQAEISDDEFDVPEEAELAQLLSSMGFMIAHARRTSIDLGVSRGDLRALIVTRRRRESIVNLMERIAKSYRFSSVIKSELLIVVEGEDEARVLKSESLEPMTVREAVERLREERGSG